MATVVLVHPADGTIEVSPEVIDFEWQEHTAYPTFELELSETADFTDSDGDGVADNVLLYIPIGQYTQGSAPGLSRYTYDDTERTENSGQGLILPESTYYWRMRGCGPSMCVDGDTEIGPWSNVFSFTTDISRPAPVPLGIRQDVTNVSPRRITEMEGDRAVPIIAWTTVTDATGYEVQLTTRETDGEADFTEPMVLELALTALLSDTELSLYSDNPKLFGDNAPVDVLTSEGYLLDGLAGGETYYWRVAAEFGEHGQGRWSEPWTFGTAPVSMKFFYYLKDHLGSVRATINGHGNVAHYDDYYPFGLQMPERTEISDAPLERYTGHELDSETGQYYAGQRYYGQLLGRWLSVDPLADQYPSHSSYNYVLNNPLRLTDPTGLEPDTLLVDKKTGLPMGSLPEVEVTAERSVPSCTLCLANLRWSLIGRSSSHHIEIEPGSDGRLERALFNLFPPIGGPGSVVSSGASKGISSVFSYITPKIAKQMSRRGWTAKMIRELVNESRIIRPAFNRATGNNATAYFTEKGAYVVRDNVTGTIVQVSDRLNPGWIPDSSIVNPYIPN